MSDATAVPHFGEGNAEMHARRIDRSARVETSSLSGHRHEGLALTIMYDGELRRGSDVLKATTLDPEFVSVGRPFLQAAAVGGVGSVTHGLHLLAEEISRNMGLLGVTYPHDMRRIALHRSVEQDLAGSR